MVARYVYLHIDANEEQANRSAWEKLYPSKGGGIPQVTVVSSDGRELMNKSGAPKLSELEELLTKSGRLLGEKALAQIKAAVETAQKAYDEGQYAKAVLTINPVLGTGGAGEAVQEAEAFGKKLVEETQAKLKAAEEKLTSEGDAALEAALEIVKINREFTKLKALAEDLKQSKKTQNHKDHRAIFEQARLLDQAAFKAANKKTKEAAAQYQSVANKYPDTAAAKFALAKIEELGEEPAKVASTGAKGTAKETTAKTASTGKSGKTTAKSGGRTTVKAANKALLERKAKSLLDTAETLADINPAAAKKNAEQVLELVPGTELAKKAEALIGRL